MTEHFDTVISDARAALSDADQYGLADLIAAYTASRAGTPGLTDARREALVRRHAAPLDPAPDGEVDAFFARHRGICMTGA